MKTNLSTYFLRHFAGTVNEFLLGDGIVGTALQCSRFSDKPSTAVAQLCYLLLNVGADL